MIHRELLATTALFHTPVYKAFLRLAGLGFRLFALVLQIWQQGTSKEDMIIVQDKSWQPCVELVYSGRVSGSIRETEVSLLSALKYNIGSLWSAS